jgi:hypothetical protein
MTLVNELEWLTKIDEGIVKQTEKLKENQVKDFIMSEDTRAELLRAIEPLNSAQRLLLVNAISSILAEVTQYSVGKTSDMLRSQWSESIQRMMLLKLKDNAK